MISTTTELTGEVVRAGDSGYEQARLGYNRLYQQLSRDALFYCEPGAEWNGSELTSTAVQWVADFARASRPYVDGAYVNVPNVSASDWETEYYGSNVDRLRQVKATYDPLNVFSFEQSVPPKTS